MRMRKWISAVILTLGCSPETMAVDQPYTLRIKFRGLVDIVRLMQRDEVVVLVPDVSVPSSLELPASSKSLVVPHSALLLGPWRGQGIQVKTCFHHEEGKPYELLAREGDIRLFIRGAEEELRLRHRIRVGSQPCRSPGECDEEANLDWLPDMDLLSKQAADEAGQSAPPLRGGLIDDDAYDGKFLAFRFSASVGLVYADSFWLDSGRYLLRKLKSDPRALVSTFVLEIPGVQEARLLVREWDEQDPTSMSLDPPGVGENGVLELVLENEPSRNEMGSCRSGGKDFAAHYVLRENSSLLAPILPEEPDGGASDDAQCSPANNTWP